MSTNELFPRMHAPYPFSPVLLPANQLRTSLGKLLEGATLQGETTDEDRMFLANALRLGIQNARSKGLQED